MGAEGARVIVSVFVLFCLELILMVVALPLYVGMQPEKAIAYLEKKKGYGEVTFNYSVRRLLSLALFVVLIIFGLVKLSAILLVPRVGGPLELYHVVDLGAAPTSSVALASQSIDIQTATVSKTLPPPQLTLVQHLPNDNYVFSGVAEPGTTEVLFLGQPQPTIYYGTSDQSGHWVITQDSRYFKLSDGNHGVTMFSYDPSSHIRSDFSNTQYFKVAPTWPEILFKLADALLDFVIVAVVIAGVFLTILTD